jgi:hypothetical protein
VKVFLKNIFPEENRERIIDEILEEYNNINKFNQEFQSAR